MLNVVAKQLRSHPAENVGALFASFLFELSRSTLNGAAVTSYQLIPLFVFIGGGATMSMLYLCRLALKNPECSWDHTNNPEPWNKLGPNDQYKLFSVNMDYSKLKKDRPDF